MSRRIMTAGLPVAALLLAAAAQAKSPWVGQWYSVPEESRRSANSFTLTALSGGRLRFAAGWQAFVLDPGGEPVPELMQPNASVRTEALTPTAFRYVEIMHGRPVERDEQRLSADGTRLIGRRTMIDADGRESSSDVVSLRVGVGRGLTGRWRELPPPPATAAKAVPPGPAQPFWDIAEDAAGVMTWRVLHSGEVLKGAADGRLYPSAGPRQPAGRFFRIKVLGPRHLQFFFHDDGHLVERTDDWLSADGRTWTDWLWSPAYPEEKDKLVYRRG